MVGPAFVTPIDRTVPETDTVAGCSSKSRTWIVALTSAAGAASPPDAAAALRGTVVAAGTPVTEAVVPVPVDGVQAARAITPASVAMIDR